MKLILCNFVMAEINQQLSQCNCYLMCTGEVSLFSIQPEHSCKHKLCAVNIDFSLIYISNYLCYGGRAALFRRFQQVLTSVTALSGREKPVAGSFETRRMRAWGTCYSYWDRERRRREQDSATQFGTILFSPLFQHGGQGVGRDS